MLQYSPTSPEPPIEVVFHALSDANRRAMIDRLLDGPASVSERDYDASPVRVFAAWASLEAKSQWFGPDGGGEGHVLDFREGGREHFEAGVGGDVYLYDALYEDIVPDERIVYTYNIHRN